MSTNRASTALVTYFPAALGMAASIQICRSLCGAFRGRISPIADIRRRSETAKLCPPTQSSDFTKERWNVLASTRDEILIGLRRTGQVYVLACGLYEAVAARMVAPFDE
jgi:hypothetical protein